MIPILRAATRSVARRTGVDPDELLSAAWMRVSAKPWKHSTYAFSVAYNAALDEVNRMVGRRTQRGGLMLDWEDEHPQPDREAILNEERGETLDAWVALAKRANLNEREHEAGLLVWALGYTAEKAAEVLGDPVTPLAVRMRLHRARRKIKAVQP